MPSELKVHDFDQLGAAGLNTQEASVSLPGPFASVAQNAVFDAEGILRPRPFFAAKASQPDVLGSYETLHYWLYTNSAGTNFEYLYVTDSGVFLDASGWGSTFGVSAGAYTDTGSSKYASCRLGDKAFFFAREQLPKVVNLAAGTGAVNDIGDAAAPQGHIALAAFGRLWTADTGSGNDDKRTLYWSVLLDGEDFSGVGSGSLDMTSIWGTSDDQITAVREFNNFLVVFSLKRVVILANPFVPSIAADGTQTSGDAMYVQDQIIGIGAISRDAATNTGEDIMFMDLSGLYSLQRVIQEKSNPMGQVCPQVVDLFKSVALTGRLLFIQTPEERQLKLVFHPITKQLLIFSGGSTHYCVHLNRVMRDVGAAVTTWTGLALQDAVIYTNAAGRTEMYGLSTYNSEVDAKVGVFYDFFGTDQPSYSVAESYTFTVASTWEVLKSPSVTKLLKRALFTYQGTAPALVTFKVKFNFQDSNEQTFTFVPEAGTGYRITSLPIGGSGETVTVTESFPVTDTSASFRINRLSLQYKLGRINSGV